MMSVKSRSAACSFAAVNRLHRFFSAWRSGRGFTRLHGCCCEFRLQCANGLISGPQLLIHQFLDRLMPIATALAFLRPPGEPP